MKSKALKVMLASLFTLTTLASCSKGSQLPEKIDNPKGFVDSNLNEVELGKPTNYDKIDIKHHSGLSLDYEVIDSSYESSGILIVKNSTDHIGVYSITADKFIVECNYYQEWLNYSVKTNIVGAFIKLDYENHVTIIDNHANILWEAEHDPDEQVARYWQVEGVLRNKIPYVTLTINENVKHFKYVNGAANIVSFIPDQIEEKLPEIEDEEITHYKPGDLFKEGKVIDLQEFGKDGYYLNGSKSGMTTLFDLNNTAISTFLVPSNSEPIITKDFIYYQKVFGLSEDNKEFNFYYGNDKYALETYRINMMDGTQAKIDFPFVVESVTPYKDLQGHYTTSIINMRAINEYRTLNDSRALLVDDQLQIKADYTQVHPESFIKIDNVYYNTKTHILYDEAMNVITYLEAMNPTYLAKHKLFVGSMHEQKGIVTPQGKVLIPFEYDEIIINDDFNNAILVKGNNHYVYSLTNKRETNRYIESKLRILDSKNGIYAIESNTGVDLVSLEGKVVNIFKAYDEYAFLRILNVDALNDNKVMVIEYATDQAIYSKEIRYNYVSMTNGQIGNEKRNKEVTGRSYEDAISLIVGENKVHANPDGDKTYLKFDCPTTGYYKLNTLGDNFITLYSLEIASYSEDYEEEIRYSLDYNERTGVLLDSNYDYYVTARFNGYRKMKVEMVSEARAFTGDSETVSSTVNAIRTISVSKDTYYKMETDNASYSIMESTDQGFKRRGLDSYYFDGGQVSLLKANTKYVFVISSQDEYTSGTFKFSKYELEDLTDYSGVDISLDAYESCLRKFTPIYDGYYTVKTNLPSNSFTIYSLDGLQNKTDASKVNVSNNNIYELSAFKTYVIQLKNTSNYVKQVTFTLTETVYQDLSNFNITDNSSIHIDYYERNIYRLTIKNSGYYYFNGYSNHKAPIVYQLDDTNHASKVESNKINGQTLYYLDTNGNYYIDVDNSDYSSYSLYVYSYELTDLPRISETRYDTFTGDNLVKFNPSKTGYYQINNSLRNVTNQIYCKTNDVYSLLKPIIAKGGEYYLLDEKQTYVVKTTTTSSEAYYLFMEYIVDDIANLPDYKINAGGFSLLSDGSYYVSGQTATLTIKAIVDGTLTFDYDIYTRNSYSNVHMKIDDVNQSIPHGYGNYSSNNVSFDLKRGQTLKVNFSYNSYYGYSSDKVKLYNFTFQPANTIAISLKNIPANKLENTTPYVWAWSDSNNGEFYKGVYDESTQSYIFYLPNDTKGFNVAMMGNSDKNINWNNVKHQTNNITIISGTTTYDCGTNWKN